MARRTRLCTENMTMESGVAALMRNPKHDLKAGPHIFLYKRTMLVFFYTYMFFRGAK